jgi:hypothetical protein
MFLIQSAMKRSPSADLFAILAGISYHLIKEGNCEKAYMLRVMTASILFYDHIETKGAFVKDSKISV